MTFGLNLSRLTTVCFCLLTMHISGFADDALDRMIASKKYADAIAYADAKLPSNTRTGDVWVKMGIANEELGTTEKALACFLVGARIEMKSHDAYLGISRIYNKLGQPDNALTYAQKAIDIRASGEASWEYAKACIALKKPADAKTALEKVVQSDPSNVAASRGLAEIYWEEKSYSKAIPLLKATYSSQPNAEDAYKIGRSLLEANRVDSAIYFLKDAITRNPSLYNANLELARAYYQKDKFLAAANEFEKIASKAKLTAADQYCRAVAQEKTGSIDGALKAYALAADGFGSEKSSDAVFAHLKVGKNDLEKKKFESAILHFKAVVEADTEGNLVPDINFLSADAYAGAGNVQKAISYLEKALAQDKNNVLAYARLADLYQKNNMPDKAKAVYEKITAISPNDPKIFFTLGDFSLKSKKYNDALKYFEKSYLIDKTAKAAAGISQAAMGLEMWDKAFDAAESAVRLDPSLTEPRIVLAKGYFRNNQYKEAKEQLEVLIIKKPEDMEYLKQLAYCHKQLNDLVNLAYVDKKIVALDSTNIESRLRLAKYLMTQKNYKESFGLYKELAFKMPQNAEVIKCLYEIANESGDKIVAASYLKKYLTLSPSDPVGQKNLGNLYYDQKNMDAALIAYRAAIKLDPTIKGVYKRYATIVIAKELKAEVQTALAGAIETNEADATMYATLGGMYQREGQCAKSIDLYQKALMLEGKNMPVLAGLAQCQAATGNIDGAIVSFEQVLALNPSAIEEYRQVGDLYLKKNRESDAANAFKKYLDKNKTEGRIPVAIAEFAFKQKNYEEAVRYYDMMGAIEGKKPDLQLHYGKSCYYLKNYKKAQAILTQLALLTPQNPEIFSLLYDIAAQDTSHPEEAITYLKKYVLLKPGDAALLKKLGDMQYDQKDLMGAITSYRKAIAADPTIKGVYKKYFEIATAQGVATEINAALTGAINAGEADGAMYATLGNSYQKQGLFAKAIPIYQKSLSLDTRNTQVLLSLAVCQMKTGAMQEASVTFEQVIAFSPNDPVINKQLGECYMSLGKKDAAIAVFKKYLDKTPKDYAVAFMVGENSFKNKDYSDAIRYLSMVFGEQAKQAPYVKMLAQSYYQTKEYAKAKVLYNDLATLYPKDASLEKMLYELSSKDKDKDESFVHLKRYTVLNPSDAQAQRDLGDILYEKKETNGAYLAYKTAITLDPTIKGLYKRYTELVMTRGTPEEVVAVLTAAVNANEADGDMYASLGSMFEKRANYVKAIQYYQKAIQIDPRNTNVLVSLGGCQVKTGAFAEASVTYEQVLAFNPQDVRIYKQVGDLYLKQQKKDQAIISYKKYLDKQPKDDAVAILVGQYSFENKNFNDAVRYLGMVSPEGKKSASFINVYAQSCYQKKDYDQAKDLYKQLASLTPQDGLVYKMLYDLCEKTNDKAGMAMYLKRYSSLNPKDAQAQRDFADNLYEQKDFAGAYIAYRNAFTLDPAIKGIYKRYAELVVANGTPEEVQKVLSAAVASGEADASVYTILGTMYEKKTNYPKAISYYNKAMEMDQRNTKILSSLARCLLKAGNASEAIITYQQVIAMNSDIGPEYKILGDLYTKQNKPDQAMEMYKKYITKVPDDVDIALILAEATFKAKDYSSSMKYLAGAQKTKGSDAEYLFMLGRSSYFAKDYKKAIDAFERSRAVSRDTKQRNPHAAVMLRMLAECYDIAGDNVNAVSVYSSYLKIPEVKDPEASFRRAQLSESVSPAVAAKYYEENTLLYPKDYRNYYAAGLFYAKQPATLEKAAIMFTKFLTLKDTLPTMWLELGKTYGKLGKGKQELNAYQQYIQRESNNPAACEEIGVNLMNRRLTNDAMVFLEMANALKPNDPDYMFQLSRGYVRTDRIADALPLLEKAEKLKPGDEKIKGMYNFVLQRSGKGGKDTAKNADW